MEHHPYKICDSVHGFIRFGELERRVINSKPFQRLRYIRQMGMAYLLYPGAAHSRFEHSIGVMELVSRCFDTLVAHYRPGEDVVYWRQVLRLAALCHDMGHLPFSHTAEHDLLPEGGHERMTVALIQSEELSSIWKELGERAERDILKLAVGEKYGFKEPFTPWEHVLSQAITEDSFGADRIDYLIRDAFYTGVGYGHFDYHQLIDSLRILPGFDEPLTIGVTEGGMQSVESLWIARYLMYARVYHHPKVRVYSRHLRRFMVGHYGEKGIPQDPKGYIAETDYVILSAMARSNDPHAAVLLKHAPPFEEVEVPEGELDHVESAFAEDVFVDHIAPKKGDRAFPVLLEGGQVTRSLELSPFLPEIPIGWRPLRLFVNPEKRVRVEAFLARS